MFYFENIYKVCKSCGKASVCCGRTIKVHYKIVFGEEVLHYNLHHQNENQIIVFHAFLRTQLHWWKFHFQYKVHDDDDTNKTHVNFIAWHISRHLWFLICSFSRLWRILQHLLDTTTDQSGLKSLNSQTPICQYQTDSRHLFHHP